MRAFTRFFSGALLIVLVSAVSASGFVSMGIKGIKVSVGEGIKAAVNRGAKMEEIKSIAASNGLELTVK